jgi:hypothetical protein
MKLTTEKTISILVVLCSSLIWALPGQAQVGQPEVSFDVRHDISAPLRDMSPNPTAITRHHVIPLGRPTPPETKSPQPDPVLQTSVGPLVSTTAGLNILGVGVGITPTYSDCCAPPDTNGAVGATQFVQWVNLDFAVFDKTTGALAAGFPKSGNSLWSGFGGPCETRNDGDPIAQYDKAAGRWVLAQPVFVSPFMYCIAVSTSSDATGTYNRYAFAEPNFPDYPKLGVWPDAFYASFNQFSGNSFVGARACAFDRTAMLAGNAATQVCFNTSSSFASLLPSDLDGTTAPPSSSPDFYVNFGSNSLNLWKFHVNFVTPTSSTFTGPTNIPVAAFSEACGGGACIPQSGTSEKLDSLGDRLMYRLAYRNFSGSHESLVVTHSVRVSGSKHSQVDGVRWYELRSPNAAPTVFQQGTYSPDSNSRWMGSIAMDKLGDIALGYSVSSGSIHPAIRYTGRVPTDALGTMESENTIIQGNGSQTTGLNRWGDYSSMAIDPSDDCTFWYANEYLQANGTFNWSTRIASFKFTGCL